MNLFLYNLEQNGEMDFERGDIVAIETNNMQFFRNILRDLKELPQEMKECALFNGNKQLALGKDYLLLIDYYDTDIITKTINGKVLKKIAMDLDRDAHSYLDFQQKKSNLYNFVLKIIEQNDIEFESSDGPSFEEVLKLFSVTVKLPRDDIYIKMINMMQVISTLKLYSLIVLVDAKSYFKMSEIAELIKMARYLDISLLFIDNRISGEVISDEKLLIVDEDYFEIVK